MSEDQAYGCISALPHSDYWLQNANHGKQHLVPAQSVRVPVLGVVVLKVLKYNSILNWLGISAISQLLGAGTPFQVIMETGIQSFPEVMVLWEMLQHCVAVSQ